jgi:hypothetical protein
MRIQMDHEYRCGVDTFWDKMFFDDEYNRRLYLDGLRFKAFEVLSLEDKPDTIVRRLRGTPTSDMPKTVEKVVGADLSYVEELVFDKKTRRARFKTTPATMADKLRIEGSIWAEPSGTGRIRRRVDMDFEAKIFGVGGLIEKFGSKAFVDNFEAAASWTNRWLAEKGLEGK